MSSCHIAYRTGGRCTRKANTHVRVRLHTGRWTSIPTCITCCVAMLHVPPTNGTAIASHTLEAPHCTHPDSDWTDAGCVIPTDDQVWASDAIFDATDTLFPSQTDTPEVP